VVAPAALGGTGGTGGDGSSLRMSGVPLARLLPHGPPSAAGESPASLSPMDVVTNPLNDGVGATAATADRSAVSASDDLKRALHLNLEYQHLLREHLKRVECALLRNAELQVLALCCRCVGLQRVLFRVHFDILRPVNCRKPFAKCPTRT
jgi:hypothetical protein